MEFASVVYAVYYVTEGCTLFKSSIASEVNDYFRDTICSVQITDFN